MNKCLNCNEKIAQTSGVGRTKQFCGNKCRGEYWRNTNTLEKVTLIKGDDGVWTDPEGKIWVNGVDPHQNVKKSPGKAVVIKKKDLKIGYPKTKKMSVKESANVMKDLLDPVKLKEKYRRLNEMEEKFPIGSAAMPPKSRPEAENKRSGAKPALSPYLQQRQKIKAGGK